MHIEDVLELVRIVRKDVASVCILGALVQVVVLLHKLLQLTLHVGDLALGEVKLIERNPCFLQEDKSEGVYLGVKQYSFRFHSLYSIETIHLGGSLYADKLTFCITHTLKMNTPDLSMHMSSKAPCDRVSWKVLLRDTELQIRADEVP